MAKPTKKASSTTPGGYELKKVAFIKGGGVKATFIETVIKDDVVNRIEKVITNPIPKHPDLDKALVPLRLHIARVYGYLDVPKQSEENVTNTISISGVSFSGDEGSETEGIVISANKTVLGGERVVALNTPNIVLGADVYSHADELGHHIEAVRKEVEAYLFDQKYSQLDLFKTSVHNEEGKLEKVA